MAIELGFASRPVVDKFHEFAEGFTTIAEAIDKLLTRSDQLTKKYWFMKKDDEVKWIVAIKENDTNEELLAVLQKLDEFVNISRLDARASAIEELLFSPSGDPNDQQLEYSLDNVGEFTTVAKEEEVTLEHVDQDASENAPAESVASVVKSSKRRKRKPKKVEQLDTTRDSLASTEDPDVEPDFVEYVPEPSEKFPRRLLKSKWRKNASEYIDWYTCVVCSEKLWDEESYMEHITKHKSRSPICMECGNYFENMSMFENHIGNLSNKLIHDCPIEGCKKSYQYHCRLEIHIRSHDQKQPYNCHDCGIKLASLRSMLRHVRGKHLNELPFVCSYCPKAFPTQPQLTKHEKDHLNPKIYTCDKCPRTFTSKQGLVYHTLDHAGLKPNKCRVCGKGFITRTDMVNHERIHSGERPFTCELCGKSFVERNALRKHRTVHTKEKNFICSYCGRQFGYKCSLVGHMKKCGTSASMGSFPPKRRVNKPTNTSYSGGDFQYEVQLFTNPQQNMKQIEKMNNMSAPGMSGTDLLASAAEVLKENMNQHAFNNAHGSHEVEYYSLPAMQENMEAKQSGYRSQVSGVEMNMAYNNQDHYGGQ